MPFLINHSEKCVVCLCVYVVVDVVVLFLSSDTIGSS